MRIALHIHVFYPELWPRLRRCIGVCADLCEEADIFVTCPSDISFESVLDSAVNNVHNFTVLPLPNRGYDIGPFFEVLSRLDLSKYDYIVKLHTKRDVDAWINRRHFIGEEWREELLSFCKDEKVWQHTLRAFEEQPKLGLVAGYSVIDPLGVAFRDLRLQTAAFIEGVGLRMPRSKFAVYGTMFVVRASLMTPFKGNVKFDDFPFITKDIAHMQDDMLGVFEYAFTMVVMAQGYYISDGKCPGWWARTYFAGLAVWCRCFRFLVDGVRKIRRDISRQEYLERLVKFLV